MPIRSSSSLASSHHPFRQNKQPPLGNISVIKDEKENKMKEKVDPYTVISSFFNHLPTNIGTSSSVRDAAD